MLTLAGAGQARADGYENVPVGSRTAAMGGAAMAGGYDSAMPTLNPAGLARIPGSVLSVSASLYRLSHVWVPAFTADGATISSPWGDLAVSQPGIDSSEISSFPSSIAYMLHFGSETHPMVVAGSLTVPRSVQRRFVHSYEFLGEGVAMRDNFTTFIDEEQYVGALSWAAGFGRLRVGASVLGSYTSRVRTIARDGLIVLGTANFHRDQASYSESLNSVDLSALAGVQVDLTSFLRVGAAVRSPSVHLWGHFKGSEDNTVLDALADSFVSTTQIEGEATRGMPLKVGLGVELFGERWSVAADGGVFIPRSAEYSRTGTVLSSSIGTAEARKDQENEVDAVEPTELVLDLALGAEVQITDTNWLRLGVFTDFTAAPPASETAAQITEQRPSPRHLFSFPLNKFGGSLGWGTKVAFVDTTLGVVGSYGSGQTLRYVPDQRYSGATPVEATDARIYEVMAFVSAALDLTEAAGGLMSQL
ncbi:MAG: hypothetical protein H6730_11715 [Deltaproteobacteria bacterium]|nr:hypothetical protein [Deltaproteobacteria bacterium]